MTKPTPTAKKALAMVRLFEESGRVVSGVTIDGTKVHVDLLPDQVKSHVPEIDLVNMGE